MSADGDREESATAVDRKDDPRYRECAGDGCRNQVKPEAGHLGGPVKCLDCLEEAKQ